MRRWARRAAVGATLGMRKHFGADVIVESADRVLGRTRHPKTP
jgi:hypothetical protein